MSTIEIDDTYERSEKELEFRTLDETRFIFLGEQRGYQVFKHPLADGYWTTLDDDFVSHHTENPLPRD